MLGLEYILSIYNMQHIELAEKLGIKKQNINLWIKRKQNIPNKYLPILEELFGIKKEYFQKELNEIEKIEIQKEKLKKELNPEFDDAPAYNKKEINEIDRDIEKAKLISKFTNNLRLVKNNQYMGTYKLLVELMDKKQHEPILNKTIEALAHYLEVLPEEISHSDEQDKFESKIFEIFNDNNF